MCFAYAGTEQAGFQKGILFNCLVLFCCVLLLVMLPNEFSSHVGVRSMKVSTRRMSYSIFYLIRFFIELFIFNLPHMNWFALHVPRVETWVARRLIGTDWGG